MLDFLAVLKFLNENNLAGNSGRLLFSLELVYIEREFPRLIYFRAREFTNNSYCSRLFLDKENYVYSVEIFIVTIDTMVDCFRKVFNDMWYFCSQWPMYAKNVHYLDAFRIWDPLP